MSNKPKFTNLTLLIMGVGTVPLFTAPAFAYIDPGTASIVLQSVIGAVAAAGLFLRTHIATIYYRLFPGRSGAGNGKSVGEHIDDAS